MLFFEFVLLIVVSVGLAVAKGFFGYGFFVDIMVFLLVVLALVGLGLVPNTIDAIMQAIS